MKRILLLFAIVTLSLGAFARQPQRGYRGFIEWDNNIRREAGLLEGSRSNYLYTGLSTSHGYQFNPHFFLGAGVAVQIYNKYYTGWILPIYLQARTDQKFGKFTPFGDMRIGYSLTDGGGIYFSPMIGYRFNWGRKLGINVGVGLTVKQITYDIFDIGYDDNGYYNIIATGKKGHYCDTFFAFKVGFDF